LVVAVTGPVPLASVRPLEGAAVASHPEGLLLTTSAEPWALAAEARVDLPEGAAGADWLVSVRLRVESGTLGAAWLTQDRAERLTHSAAVAAERVVELRLVVPAAASTGVLAFQNWTEGGAAARAVIAGITLSRHPYDRRAAGIDFEWAEICDADELVSGPAGAVARIELTGDGSAAPFRVYRARDALVVGSPGVIGVRQNGRFACLRESANHTVSIASLLDQAVAPLKSRQWSGAAWPSACLLDGQYAQNIWHWLMEWVVKAVALEEAGFDGVYLLPSGRLYMGSLELLGIPGHRLVTHNTDYVLVEELSFTQPTFGFGIFYQYPWILHRLRERIEGLAQPGSGARRVYIARRGKRRLVNEAEIQPILENFGFLTVYMEDHPIEEQIATAAQAEVVLGPHGAGLALSMFMRPGGALIEMFSNEFINPHMLSVCQALDLNYYMLTPRKYPEGTFGNPEVEVDPEILQLTLRNATTKRSSAGLRYVRVG
jgi:hypothetical protein